jgi:GNAT superfamily N-acetyltransferase
MEIKQKKVFASGFKFVTINKNKQEIGRAYLYVMQNDLHKQPFGFMEDVYVNEKSRGEGAGKLLVEQVIKKSREIKCYKLIATSRYQREKVHQLYKKLGFYQQGVEFRIDF